MGCLTIRGAVRNAPVETSGVFVNDISIEVQDPDAMRIICAERNTKVRPRSTGLNTKPHLTIALVCQVSLGEYEYFYVQDEPLMVTNGYFLVKRQNRL